MRICVPGASPTASGLRGLLQAHGFQIVSSNATYTIEIEEIEHTVPHPIVDGVNSEFERQVVHELAELAGAVLIQRAGGIQQADWIKISIETNEDHRWHVQRAVYRALCHMRKDPKPWFGRKKDPAKALPA